MIATALAGAGLAGAALLGYSTLEARWYRLRRLMLPDTLRRPGATLRVLHVSDVHLAHGQEHRVRFLRSLAELEPDLTVITGDLLGDVLPEDLVRFGLIPEFVGRLPVVASVEPLSTEALIDILTTPRNALVKQYQRIFALDGVELEFSPDALAAIADLAMLRQTGARGLRAILEEVLLGTMYDLPSRQDVGRCVIDAATVREQANPTLVPHTQLRALPRERSA